MCVCVRPCVRVCVRACVCVCLPARLPVCLCVGLSLAYLSNQWSDSYPIWHCDCRSHGNAPRVNVIGPDSHPRSHRSCSSKKCMFGTSSLLWCPTTGLYHICQCDDLDLHSRSELHIKHDELVTCTLIVISRTIFEWVSAYFTKELYLTAMFSLPS